MSDPVSPAPSPVAPVDSAPPGRRWPWWRIVLVGLGWLLLVPSGLCTGFFLAIGISDRQPWLVDAALVMGGPLIVVGAALAWFARPRERNGYD